MVQRDPALFTHKPSSLPVAGRRLPGFLQPVPCRVPGNEEGEAVEWWTESSLEYGGGCKILLHSFQAKFTLRPLKTSQSPPHHQFKFCARRKSQNLSKSLAKKVAGPSSEPFPKTRTQAALRSAMGCLPDTFVRKSFPGLVPA